MTLTPYYLHAGGRLSDGLPSEDENVTSSTYQHDSGDPVPSISVPRMFADYQARFPADQREPTTLLGRGVPGRPLAERVDVLVF